MTFVEKILPYERDLFLCLNNAHSAFGDIFMPIYSGKLVWLPLLLVTLYVLIYKQKWREVVLIMGAAILLVLLTDYVSASFIKPYFARLRPSHHEDFKAYVMLVNGKTGGQYGFISNHAANGFGLAVFTSLIFRYRYYTISAFLWALITCYSRIYLGVHFISDVVGGALWGSLAGVFVYYVYLTSCKRWLKIAGTELKVPLVPINRVNLVVAAIWLTILCIAIYSLIANIIT